MFQEIIGLLITLVSMFGVSFLYIFMCKNYTIKKVKELELELSKFDDISDEERELLNNIRQFLHDPAGQSIKSD